MFLFLASYSVEGEQVENGVRKALHKNYELTHERNQLAERDTRNQPQSQCSTDRTCEDKLLLHKCWRKPSVCRSPVKAQAFGTVFHTVLSMSFQPSGLWSASSLQSGLFLNIASLHLQLALYSCPIPCSRIQESGSPNGCPPKPD